MPRSFEPQFMKIGVLTAALQELTPRDVRDDDPDRAVEEWIAFAREMGADNIQLSAALHPSESDVPPEAMLDPVANTLDLREPFDVKRAERVMAAQKEHRIGFSDLAYFDNMLHHDSEIRKKKHDFMLRVYDAAVLLGTDAKERGLSYRVEQCPMPGWTTGDSFHNNIAYAPGPWITLHRICEKHGVGDQFRIHYDPSHSILMGRTRARCFSI